MGNDDAAELQKKLREEITTRRAEREAAHKRALLLQLAGQIAGGLMSAPPGWQSPFENVAATAVKLAEHIITAVDRAMSPVTPLATADDLARLVTQLGSGQ